MFFFYFLVLAVLTMAYANAEASVSTGTPLPNAKGSVGTEWVFPKALLLSVIDTTSTTPAEQPKDGSERWKNYAQIAAWGAAAIYFAMRFFSGFLLFNLSLEVHCKRAEKNSKQDFLIVNVKLSKGTTAAARVRGGGVVVTQGTRSSYSDLNIVRVDLDEMRKHPGKKSLSTQDGSLAYTLAPGEYTTFSLAEPELIDSSDPCTVDVVIVGTPTFWLGRKAQWRARTISLPSSRIGYSTPAHTSSPTATLLDQDSVD